MSGTEAEKVAVSVGQKVSKASHFAQSYVLTTTLQAINERIKELDFQDCKFRVTNVDSQGSGSNIVIQVIGEISTKSLPQKKFTQTFVLAEQQNGYFVLNDIFRYLLEEEEDIAGEPGEVQQPAIATGTQEPQASLTESAPPAQVNGEQSAAQGDIAEKVDVALEQAIEEQPALAAEVSEDAPAEVPAEAESTKPEEPVVVADSASTEAASTETAPPLEQIPTQLQPEKPKDPEPTPVASPPKPAAAQPVAAAPAEPPKPAAPKTWASMLAAGKKPIPAVPVATPAAAAQPKAAPTTSTPAPKTATPTPSAAAPTPSTEAPEPSSTPVSSGSEWQTAGADHNKKGRTQQVPQQPEEGSRGYIKNVTDNIDGNELRAVLSTAAKVKFLDISRVKVSEKAL